MSALDQLRVVVARLASSTTPHIHRRREVADDWAEVRELLDQLDQLDQGDQGDDDEPG